MDACVVYYISLNTHTTCVQTLLVSPGCIHIYICVVWTNIVVFVVCFDSITSNQVRGISLSILKLHANADLFYIDHVFLKCCVAVCSFVYTKCSACIIQLLSFERKRNIVLYSCIYIFMPICLPTTVVHSGIKIYACISEQTLHIFRYT